MSRATGDQPDFGQWSSEDVARSDRTDAWRATLASNYRLWEVPRSVSTSFRADIRHRMFDALRVVDCICDPCSGSRLRSAISQDGEPHIGVQVTKSGRERFDLGAQTVAVGVSEVVIWSSDQPSSFEVTERLHKVSLIVPWSEVRERLPSGTDFKGLIIDSRTGIGAVLSSHVSSLAAQLDTLSPNDNAAVQRATLELLVAAMTARMDVTPRRLAERYLSRLQDYILANLHDENLSPASIARAHRISVRYVHSLFAQLDQSVSSWIRLQRLERCREALCNHNYRNDSVAEIAYRWGFADATHFGRIFRHQYGVSPNQLRTEKER